MKILLFIGLLVLTGCAGVMTNIEADLAKIQAVAVPDLQAALADAKAHSDQAAANCYTALLDIMQSHPPTLPTVKGAFSGFQAARDAIGGSGVNDVAKAINLGCASLFVESAVTVGALASKLGFGVP